MNQNFKYGSVINHFFSKMRKHKRNGLKREVVIACLQLLLLLGIGFNASELQAQQFPVQATTVLTPPYSIYLSDYTSPESNSLQVILSLRELDRPEYRAKLRLKIEGQGITIQTRPGYTPAPLILQGGIPETLTGDDLRGYFNPDNLVFDGLSRNEFIQSGTLPEGFYTFTFEVLDYTRNVVVSNPAMANAWLVLNDPPLINLPFNGEKVRATDPQNILFSWTPRHTASPNSAFNTEYEFTLVELWPTGRNPNDAILASNPIFQRTTNITSLNYGIAEPILIPGRKYAFRVRAYDIDGRDLFKNQGYSEVFVFQFGDECLSPTDLSGKALDPNRIELNWEGQEIHTEYDIRYRVEGTTDWFASNTFSNKQIIPELQGNTTYEYQIRGKCSSIIGPYSASATISTPEIEEDAFVCGSDIPQVELDTNPFEGTLNIDDEIETADFKITIKELEANSDGSYKGMGIAQVPYLEFASIRVKFDAIRINGDFRVYEGNITSIYNENSKFILQADLTGDEMDQEDDAEGEDEGEDPDNPDGAGGDGADAPADTTTITTDQPIVDATVNEEGDVILTYGDGTTETFEVDEDGVTEFEDSDGNTVTVDGDGNIDWGSDDGSGVIADAGSDLSTGNVSIGPISIVFDEAPVSSETDADGYCTYTDVVTTSIEFIANDQSVGSYNIVLPAAVISFKQHCVNQDFKDVTITWSVSGDDEAVQLGEILLVDGIVEGAQMAVDADGNLTGTLSVAALMTEDKEIDDYLTVQADDYGDFTFTFAGTTESNGLFDLSTLTPLHIDLLKNSVVMASMTDGTFNSRNMLSGNLTLPGTEPTSYAGDYFTTTYQQLDIQVSYEAQSGFAFNGTANIGISDFLEQSAIQGNADFTVNYANSAGNASEITGDLTAYGMTLSDYSVVATFDEHLDMIQVNGSMSATHPAFTAPKNTITVDELIYSAENQVEKFSSTGEFTYPMGDISECVLLSSTISTEENALAMEVVGTAQGQAYPIEGFKILYNGDIEAGEVGDASSADALLGPIIVSFGPEDEENFDISRSSRVDGKRTQKITSQNNMAEITLKVELPNGDEYSRTLSGVNVEYLRFRSDASLISGTIRWTGEEEFASIWGIPVTITDINLAVDSEGNLLSEDEDGNTLGVTLSTALDQDISINDAFKVKSGMTGSIVYQYSGENSFAGDFNAAGLENINVVLQKGETELASISNGQFNQEGVFSGTLTAPVNGVAYTTNSFDVTLNSLSVEAAYSFKDNTLDLKSGSGTATIGNISGIDGGSIAVNLIYSDLGVFEAQLQTEDVNISAFGFNIDPGSLRAVFDENYNLTEISGAALTATHSAFDAQVTLEEFMIQSGSLQSITASGSVTYEGFDFNLSEGTYADNKLVISADLALNLTGTQGSFAVEDFTIHEDGSVSLGAVAGNVDVDNIANIDFSARFTNTDNLQRFQGTFNGSIDPISLTVNGQIDIGKKSTGENTGYNFAYLKLAAGLGRGVPLGPTGLQIDRVGGLIGYNYRLTHNSQTGEFTGDPRYGNYLIGFTIGVSDVSNTVSVDGTPIVQFSSESFDFGMIGNLNIPKTDPWVSSQLTLNYSYPANSVSANFTTDFKIPRSTGSIFNANIPIGFEAKNSNWKLESGNISGQVLSKVNFNGRFLFNGSYSSDGIILNKVDLNGTLNFDYTRNFRLEVGSVLTAQLDVDASFTATANVKLDQNGLATSFEGNARATLGASASVLFVDFAASATVNAQAIVSYDPQTGGYMDASGYFSFKDLDFSVPVDIGYRFDGQNSNVVQTDVDENSAPNFGTISGTTLIIRDVDIDKITGDSYGGSNITAFNNIRKVKLRGQTYDLPTGLRIQSVDGSKVFIPGFCFVAGTQIRLSDNSTMSIEDIKKGEEVFSYNHKCEDAQPSKVTKLYEKTVDKLVRVMIGGEEFYSTDNHPYYANNKYIEAGDLQVGDSVLNFSGSYDKIQYVTTIDTTATVYNFSVAGNHNYYIGETGYLVHNDCKFVTKIQPAVLAKNNTSLNAKLDTYYDESMKQSKEKRTALNAKVARLPNNDRIAKFIEDYGNRTRDLTQFFADAKLATVYGKFGDSPLRKDLNYLKNIRGVPTTWTITYSGGVTKLFYSNGRELATLKADEIIADGGSSGNWNTYLNKPLMPNQTYKVDNYTFYTDAYARVSRVTGTLRNTERGRLDYQQGYSVSLKDGTPGQDDGGHLIANILYGPGEQINYVPMRQNLNRGDYKSMETRWKNALANGTVRVSIVCMYRGDSKRPYRIVATEVINNGSPRDNRFEN